MKLKLLLCLFAGFGSANAANYVGDQTFSPPYAVGDDVHIVGNLTFAGPGDYSAASWSVVGSVRFAQPGNYVFTATRGGMSASASIQGPASGTAVVHLSYRGDVNFVGLLPLNVIVVDDQQARVPGGQTLVLPPPPAAPLQNLSVRAIVGEGGAVIPGFVVGGDAPRRVLIRAIGPGLSVFGIKEPLADPTLTVFNGATAIAANDNWGGADELAATFAAVGAFGLGSASKDAAVVVTLAPGAYTVAARGASATDRGEVLIEVYLVQ